MMSKFSWRAAGALALAAFIAGCSTTGGDADKPVPPGHYAVRPGDTLYSIAQKAGRDPREIARWNQLDDPNRIEIGQVLRIVPPGGAASAPRRSADEPRGRAPSASAPPPPSKPAEPVIQGRGDWAWPAQGPLLTGYNGGSSKGIDIGGKLGDPVVAVEKGEVSLIDALRGYGKVLMIDHGGGRLSVYTHLQSLAVSKGQSVRRGQKIGEMGNGDGGRAKLHFEVRQRGTAVDPARYLSPK